MGKQWKILNAINFLCKDIDNREIINNIEILEALPKKSENCENNIQTQVKEIVSKEEKSHILFNNMLKLFSDVSK